jgi:hypothetical protein
MRTFIYGMVTTVLLLACVAARADVFKCTAEDGSLTYQQTPCPEQKVEKLQTQAPATDAQECGQAQLFAVIVARLRRSSARSDEVFDRYGGLDALSKGSIGVINYVYTFRTNDDVSVDRIAALTRAKCQARSLGEVSCETLPSSFTENLVSCNPELTKEEATSRAEFTEPAPAVVGQSRTTASATLSAENIAQCKKKHRDAIDVIDAEMRRGYTSEQGEIYRQRLRVLTEQLRSC